MPVHVKIGGAWKQATAVYNKVGGVWKTAADMPVKVGGVWKTGILASGAFESIATATGTGSSGTITFSSIPSTYQYLQLRANNLSSENGTTGSYAFYIGFNSDTGANYANHNLSGNGTTVSASGLVSTTPGEIGRYVRNGETYRATAIIDIHDYASTSKYKTVKSISGYDANGTGAIYLDSVLWMNTAAISTITLTGNGNWKTGSTFALYGIKGA